MAHITIEDVRTFITPRQAEHLGAMDEETFTRAYNRSVGYIKSQIGELYVIDEILNEPEYTDYVEVMRWLLVVFTSWYMAASASQQSVPLMDAYTEAKEVLKEMKYGNSVMANAPHDPRRCIAGATSKRFLYRG